MKDFNYAAPRSLGEAHSILAQQNRGVKFLAGGTDILVQLREGQRQTQLVVDVKQIPELLALRWQNDGGLYLGAAVPCIRIYRNQQLAHSYPAISDAARIIGGWQIQSRATLGGNLCNASPAADSIPALIASGAVCRIAGPEGNRQVAVEDFCTGPGRTVLGSGELLTHFEVPTPARCSSSAYLRFIPRNEMDIAVAGAGVSLQLDRAGEVIQKTQIALAAVGPTPLLAAEAAAWLQGKTPTDEHFRQAGELAREVAQPISDLRGPADYRHHLVGVLTRRALTKALQRIGENEWT